MPTFVEVLLLLVPLAVAAVAGTDTRAGAHTRHGLGYVARWAKRSPATTFLIVVVLFNVVFLETLPHTLQEAVLRGRSTNLRQLERNPFYVLVTSAFWITPGGFGFVALMGAFVLAPAERFLGTARWLVAFFTGHVGATLVVSVWLQVAFHRGLVDASVRRAIDVGVSYGTFCLVFVAAAAILAPWRRALWLTTFGLYLGVALAVGRTFTDLGHACAALLGIALWPLLMRDPSVRERATARWWNQPLPDRVRRLVLRKRPAPAPVPERSG